MPHKNKILHNFTKPFTFRAYSHLECMPTGPIFSRIYSEADKVRSLPPPILSTSTHPTIAITTGIMTKSTLALSDTQFVSIQCFFCQQFRFSITTVVSSVSNVTSLQDCQNDQIVKNCQIGQNCQKLSLAQRTQGLESTT